MKKSKISRREFLKITAAGAATSILAGCQNPRQWVVLEPYVHAPEDQLTGVANWYASTCRQCPAGCGIIVRIMNGRALKLEGNPEHPLNQGKLCARGHAGLQVLYNPDRLEGPVIQSKRGTHNFSNTTWEEGINTIFSKIQSAGSGLGVWLGSTSSGHLVDLFQRFTNAVGAPAPVVFDLYTAFHGYSSLQQSSHNLFESPNLPAYDIGAADVIFSFGANLFGTWLSSTRYGIEYGRFRDQTLGKRGYLVQFEPRMSITGSQADRWEPLRPGSETLVAQAIVRLIADRGYGPAERVNRARSLASDIDVNSVAAASDISIGELNRLARIFAENDRVAAIPGSPLSGQENPQDAINAVQVLNVIAGTIGQPGGLSLSSNTSPKGYVNPGISSYSEVQKLIDRMNSGDVQVLLVHNANPAYDLPEQAGFVKALEKVPYIVTFAPIVDETSGWADMILPDRTYLESWGYEVVSPNFDGPVISSQQPVVQPVYDVRSTADVLLTIARGIPAAAKALPWSNEVAFLKELAAQLPPAEYGGSGSEVLWARFLQHGGWWPASETPPSAPSPQLSAPIQVGPPQYQGNASEYPYFLHIFMSDLLSDGRGASQPWLQGSPDTGTTIAWQTWVELNPATADKLGLKQGDLVKVTSLYGELEAPIYLYPGIRPDTVAIPLGQGHTDYGRYARDRGANVIQLVGSQPDTSAENLVWSTLRVSLTPTGKKMTVATFENSLGVTEGFINQAFPGQ
jgi:anaerobic selenocysteine-containing dehydrogenase